MSSFETGFINHYHCDHEDTPYADKEPAADWSDEWSCACDDRCPVCNHEIVPYDSEELEAE
jgi:hypothetical protein